jgi:hypothetical protein
MHAKLNFMSRFTLVLACAASLVSAADFNGRWFGSMTYDGDSEGKSLCFELRQVKDRIAGTMLARGPILYIEGEAKGNAVKFRMQAEREELFFEAALTGDRMLGRVGIRKDGKDNAGAKLEAFRATSGASPFAGAWTGEITPAREGAETPEKVSLRIFSHSAGAGGFVTLPGGEEVFSMGEIRDDKLTFELARKGERFELSTSGDRLEGSVRAPSFDGKNETFRTTTLRATRQPVRSVPRTGILGNWAASITVPEGLSLPFPFHLERSGNVVGGGVTADTRRAFSEVAIAGDRVTFRLTFDDDIVRFDLTAEGDLLTGTATETRKGKVVTYKIRGVRRL